MIASAKGKFEEARGHISDEPTLGLIKQQLAGFADFIRLMNQGRKALA